MTVSAIPEDFPLLEQETARSSGFACKSTLLTAASLFNEPVCKVREFYYSFSILKGNLAEKVAKVFLLTLGIILCALITPFTAPVGAVLRGIVACDQAKPYIFQKRGGDGKVLPESRTITLVTHNQCYVPGGFCITDGGVDPSKKRMEANIQKVKELKPDIACLLEVEDIRDASHISKKLADYPFVIPVSGMRAVGPSSMMYVASKYEIDEASIDFVPFIKGSELTGTARFSEKGYLSFDLKEGGITVVTTHMQHSEIPAAPTEQEQKSREAQMLKIVKHIEKKVAEGRAVIFSGDLNLDEKELNAFLEKHQIHWLKRDPAVVGKPTWRGDFWCAKRMKKPPSGPQVLDYAFIAGKATSIVTEIIGTGYCATEFRSDGGSDHDLLLHKIVIGTY